MHEGGYRGGNASALLKPDMTKVSTRNTSSLPRRERLGLIEAVIELLLVWWTRS